MNPLHRQRSALEKRYLIEGEAGAGGMATVYRARDVRLQRRVALARVTGGTWRNE